MHTRWYVIFIIFASAVIAAMLFLYGTGFQKTSKRDYSGFTVLAQGENASSITQRVNYRITNADDFTALWTMVYGRATQLPIVDFTKNDVLAVFDGSHTSSGYAVRIKSINDVGGNHVITIIRISPGDTCNTVTATSNPFIIVSTPKTTLPVVHVEEIATTTCN